MSASMRELGTFVFPFLLLCSCSFPLPRSSFSILPFVLLAALLPFLIPPSPRFPSSCVRCASCSLHPFGSISCPPSALPADTNCSRGSN